jgi:hypothetical protein
MRISGAMNPEAAGAITDSENVVGEITLGGTVALLVFNGLLVGLMIGITWVVVRDWIPGSGSSRVLLGGVLALLTGGSAVIDSENVDFILVEPAWLHVVMFLGLVAGAGSTTAALDRAFEHRLPAGETAGAILGGLAGVGVLALPLLVGYYFVPGTFQHGTPPWPAGLAFGAVAIATCASWVSFYRPGSIASAAEKAPWERVLGYGGVVLFGLFGGLHLASEVSGVLR